MKKALATALAAAAVLTSSAIQAQGNGHGHDHSGHSHNHPAQEAKIIINRTLTIKGVAIIEFIHNQTDGQVTMSVMDEKKAALVPEKAPRLNLIVGSKRKQLKSTAVEGETAKFTVTDEVLKGALNGKVAIKIAGNSHQVVIDPHFGHNHGTGGNHH